MVSLCSSLLIVAAASSVAAFSPSQSMRAKSNAHKYNVPLCESSNNNNSGGYLDSLSSSSSSQGPSSSQQAANENIEYDDFDDFVGFQSTQIISDESSEDTNQDNGASSSTTNEDTTEDDTFLSSLQSRLQQFESKSNTLPLMILDTMLPRQILQIQIQHPTLKALMKHRYREEIPTLGMLGMAKLSTGQTLPLKTGVEVEIIQMDKPTDILPSDIISDNGEEPWDVSLRAGRRFIIEGNVEKNEQGWTEASVKFLDSTTEEENEIHSAFDNPNSAPTEGSSDRLSVARAISKSKQFTEPNMNMKDGASLIERWIELAKENERHPGQIDVLLQQLGEIPPEHEPTNRSLWVGALINPLPSMGVAKEIRPQLLVSKRAEERVQVALVGLLQSIKHMDGSAPMW